MKSNASILGERIATFVDAADRNRFLLMAVLGYGLCRLLSNYPTGFSGFESVRVLSEISKVAGIVTFAALQMIFDKGDTNRILFFLPMTLTLLGCGGIAAQCALPAEASLPLLEGASVALSASGSAALMLQWLELFALAPMRHIALAIAGAELANSMIALLAGEGSPAMLALALPISCLLLIACRRGWELTPGRAPQSLPRTAQPLVRVVPWEAVLWVGIFSLAYGYITSSAGLALSSAANNVGNVLPSAVVLLMAALLPQKFDLRLLKGTALAFMTAGLLLTGLDAAGGWTMQMFASAGAASCRLFAYSLACIHSHSKKASALPSCAAVKIAIIAATSLGITAGAGNLVHAKPYFFVGLAVALSLMSAFLSPIARDDENQAAGSAPQAEGSDDPEAARARLAKQAGLTERERDVFELMAQGLPTAAICDELFISKSTVRAHQSRIYGKLGVHTQQELANLIGYRTECSAARQDHGAE